MMVRYQAELTKFNHPAKKRLLKKQGGNKAGKQIILNYPSCKVF